MLQKEFHISLAETFVQDIQQLTNYYYYFLGRIYPWGEIDTAPPQKIYTSSELNTIRSDSLYYKKVQPSDISLVINRYDWTSGTVYPMWDNTISMYAQNFYVVTYDSEYSRYNIYKCIDNNNNSQSTAQPTGTVAYSENYADGYVWKYMYSVTETMMDTFGSVNKIPVQVAMSSHFYNKGTIANIAIIDGGSGYTGDETVFIEGDGTGADATIIVVDGVITQIQTTSHGQGYTYATVTTTAPDGTMAKLKAIIQVSSYETEQAVVEQLAIKGGIHAIRVTNGGTFYSNQTTIAITGDGTGAEASLTIVDGNIQKVNIINPGVDYTYANITITDPRDAERPSNSINFSGYVILPPDGGHGKNAVTELYASEISISSQIPLMSFQNSNDFRQVGIVKNPTYTSSGKYFRDNNQLACYEVSMNSTNNLVIDSILTSNSATDTTSKYRVVYFESATGKVLLQPLTRNSKTPSALVGTQSYFVQSVISSPTIDKYSGEILYVLNNGAFATVNDQTITLKTNIRL